MSGSMENVRLLVLGEVTRRRVTIYSVRTLPQKRSVRLKFRWRINFKDGHDSAFWAAFTQNVDNRLLIRYGLAEGVMYISPLPLIQSEGLFCQVVYTNLTIIFSSVWRKMVQTSTMVYQIFIWKNYWNDCCIELKTGIEHWWSTTDDLCVLCIAVTKKPNNFPIILLKTVKTYY